MMSKSQRVKGAVYQHPLLLGHYFNNPEFNNRLTHQIMHKLIPFSCGIEIECMGSLGHAIKHEARAMENYIQVAKRKFNLMAYNEDLGPITVTHEDFKAHYNEHKLRIINYSQLPGLYLTLEAMKVHCQELKTGGLHIHVDAPFLKHIQNLSKLRLRQELERNLPNLIDQFNYHGNQMHVVSYELKNACINIRDEFLHTIEFRMGHCTFDYEQIVKWMVLACSEVKRVKKSLNI